MTLTPQQRLELLDILFSENYLSEEVLMDEISERQVTQREKKLAVFISQLYRIVHSGCEHECKHPDWEMEACKLYDEIKK